MESLLRGSSQITRRQIFFFFLRKSQKLFSCLLLSREGVAKCESQKLIFLDWYVYNLVLKHENKYL